MSERFYVLARDGFAVLAQDLEVDGKPLLDPSGKHYKVPADFDWKKFIGELEGFRASIGGNEAALQGLPDLGGGVVGDTARTYGLLINRFFARRPASQDDVQRTSGHFVPAFRPAASFLYGVACAALGLDETDALAGGGAHNIVSYLSTFSFLPEWVRAQLRMGKVDLSGRYWNAAKNVPHIRYGWSSYNNGFRASDKA